MKDAQPKEIDSYDRDYSERYDRLAEKAMSVCWHLPIAMTEKLCCDLEGILEDRKQTNADEAIFRRIRGYCLHPAYMARLTYIFYHKAMFRNHAYLVDEAVQTLYAGQFSASAHASVAALEGVLCLLTDRSKFDRNAVQRYFAESSLNFSCLEIRGRAYARNFMNFCVDWLFWEPIIRQRKISLVSLGLTATKSRTENY